MFVSRHQTRRTDNFDSNVGWQGANRRLWLFTADQVNNSDLSRSIEVEREWIDYTQVNEYLQGGRRSENSI